MSQTRSGLTINSSLQTLSGLTLADVANIYLDGKILAVGKPAAIGVSTYFEFPRGGQDVDTIYIIDDDEEVSVFSKTNDQVTVLDVDGDYVGKVALLGTKYEARLDLNEPFVRNERGEVDFSKSLRVVRTEIRHRDSGGYDVYWKTRKGATAQSSSFSPTTTETGRYTAMTGGPAEHLDAYISSNTRKRCQITGYTQFGIAGEA